MGGGEMGYLHAPGVRSVPDPVEYVRIRGDQLKARDGRYELRVTNELEEALFVDRLHLWPSRIHRKWKCIRTKACSRRRFRSTN